MADEELKPGDIVQLKSGGPRMTISGISQELDAHCFWFHTEQAEKANEVTINISALKKPDPDKPRKDYVPGDVPQE